MTNALRPGELFGLRWSCFDPNSARSRSKRPPTRGKFVPGARPRRSLTNIPIAQHSRTNSCLAQQCREEQQRKKHGTGHPPTIPKRSFFRDAEAGSSIRATTAIGCCTSWRRTGAAEADVPGHPPHHCDAGQGQGPRQGHPGNYAPLPPGHDHGCLYAVARKRRPFDGQLHSRRVERHPNAGNGADAASGGSDQPRGISQSCGNAKRQSISAGAVSRFGRGKSSFKPARGVVLEFATRMRQSGRKEMGLSS